MNVFEAHLLGLLLLGAGSVGLLWRARVVMHPAHTKWYSSGKKKFTTTAAGLVALGFIAGVIFSFVVGFWELATIALVIWLWGVIDWARRLFVLQREYRAK